MKILLLLTILLSASMTEVPEELVARQHCSPVIGASCVVDTHLMCPPGYLDGCITKETRVHTCVLIEEGPSCELDFKLICPENFEDGCLSGATEIHACVPVRKNLCHESERLSCPIGFEDSCLK